MKNTTQKSGFTIVELLIVIVVIAILAAITILSYNGITERAEISILKENLRNISQQVELDKVDRGTYAPNLNDVKNTDTFLGGDYTYAYETDGLTFCIEGKKISKPELTYFINTKTGVLSPEKGDCGGVAVTDIQTQQVTSYMLNGEISVSGDLTKILAPNGYSLNYSSDTGVSWSDLLYESPMSTEFENNLNYPDETYGQYDVSGGAISSSGSQAWLIHSYSHSGADTTNCVRKLQPSGATWDYTSSPSCNATRTESIRNVAVSDDGSRIAYTDYFAAQVNISTNGGSTWDLKNICGCGGGNIDKVKMSPSGMILMAHHSNRLARSTDGGQTWTSQIVPVSNNTWASSALAFSDDGQTIAYSSPSSSRSDGVYISRDGGETWAERMSSPKLYWTTLSVSSSGQNMVGIAKSGSLSDTNSAVYASNDYGETWKKLSELNDSRWIHSFVSKDGTKGLAIRALANGDTYVTTWRME